MVGNSKIAAVIGIGGTLVAIAGSLLLSGVWVGAQETDLKNHKEQPYHREAGRQIHMLQQRLTGLEATVRETGKATEKRIENLRTEQRLRFDNLERILRQQKQE